MGVKSHDANKVRAAVPQCKCTEAAIVIKFKKNGAPGEIRTPDTLIRSQVLYPAELRAHIEGRD